MKIFNETDRIIQAYERRREKGVSKLYSFFDPANLFIVQQRDKGILSALKNEGITSLNDKKILDVGCGIGSELRNFVRYGASPENLYGIDLLKFRVDEANKINSNINIVCGDASHLPYEDSNFDIIIQFTMFTSILDKTMKKNIATEMLRVLKSHGIILWYDFRINNPKNPDVRGIKREEIYELFPNCEISLKKVTLAPPLTRAIATYSWIGCYLLEKIPLLRTHYLGIIKRHVSDY